MNSASDRIDRPPEDLTARARIRDAALAQFAERGFKGATVKSIADEAGVSPGLLQHHFGSKDELRHACDEYVLDAFSGLDKFGVTSGEITSPEFMGELFSRSPLITRYIARAMVEGSPAASAVFDTSASVSEEFFRRFWPDRFPEGSDRVRDAAAVLAAMHLSTVVLHERLSQRMDTDVLSAANSSRIALAMFDVYACVADFLESDVGHGIHDAVVKQQQDQPPTNGHDDE
ncbi:TetR family transcriptional regulator [Haloactinospora alba]|uniref:TetR family transcriptional regulator n=1 Tax=Haloactinospora alba TaxID=405555 RepID=A0A543NEI2_9ACTN|nr:TetR/AcrR family transcriptional regulator [Haloactinospora alba]TQN30251.1 TetR family transcriptional regulator [Haloactinospora alba]